VASGAVASGTVARTGLHSWRSMLGIVPDDEGMCVAYRTTEMAAGAQAIS
jgi:hypothetical protein